MVTLSNNYNTREKYWTQFVSELKNRNGILQFDETDAIYELYFTDGPDLFICLIYKDLVPNLISNVYSQEQNGTDRLDFENNYKNQSNKSILPPKTLTNDYILRVACEKSDRNKVTLMSHDWTDPTTWYSYSIKVFDEIPTNSGDNIKYTLSHSNIIDTYHGLITGEDYLENKDGYSYRVQIKVNDIIKTEQDPHYGSGGDFVINYKDGYITFQSELNVDDEIKVTYNYASNSIFTLKPEDGKVLKIESVEVQFSQDVIVKDTIVFQPFGPVDVFAPNLMPGVPSGTKIPLGNPVKYKSMSDFQNEAERSYPVYPALGGNNWRGCQFPIIVMDWDYISSTILYSDYGMEIQIFLEHNEPFDGWFATATFYCTSE